MIPILLAVSDGQVYTMFLINKCNCLYVVSLYLSVLLNDPLAAKRPVQLCVQVGNHIVQYRADYYRSNNQTIAEK